MANKHFIVKRDIAVPNTGAEFWGVWVCDTYAGRPVTGLVKGELGIMLDLGVALLAASTTTWGIKVLANEVWTPALLLGDVLGNAYVQLIGDGLAVGPNLMMVPTDPGGTLISNYLAQTLYGKTMDVPTLIAPVVITTSGTAVIRIGEHPASSAYAGFGLHGSLAAGELSFYSSPGDNSLYINRKTGGSVAFRENDVDQMSLISGGALVGKMDTMTYAATISLNITLGNTHKTTLTGNATINASAAGSGDQHMTVILVNDATLARTTTFGTNFRSAGTVVGTVSKVAVVKFVSDGAAWFEESRTLVL